MEQGVVDGGPKSLHNLPRRSLVAVRSHAGHRATIRKRAGWTVQSSETEPSRHQHRYPPQEVLHTTVIYASETHGGMACREMRALSSVTCAVGMGGRARWPACSRCACEPILGPATCSATPREMQVWSTVAPEERSFTRHAISASVALHRRVPRR